MFTRKMSWNVPFEEDFPKDHKKILEEYDRDVSQAQDAYEKYLSGRDFSKAGDLLPYFMRDFFHDSSFANLSVKGDEKQVSFQAEAILSRRVGEKSECISAFFNIVFNEVVWMSIFLEEQHGDYGDYRYGEIDGLDKRIATANNTFGPEFHSLTIETGSGGWLCFVFRSVSVTPTDSIQWLRILHDQDIELPPPLCALKGKSQG